MKLLDRLEELFLKHVFSSSIHFGTFATAVFVFYMSILIVDRQPKGIEVFYEFLWIVLMVSFIIGAPYYIKNIYERIGQFRQMVLSDNLAKIISGLFVFFYPLFFIMMLYDVFLAPPTGFWLVVYGRNAALIHYGLILVCGIPYLFFHITLAARIVSHVNLFAEEMDTINTTDKLFQEIDLVKESSKSLDRMLLLIFFIVTMFGMTILVRWFTLIDIATIFTVVGIYIPLIVACILIVNGIRGKFRTHCMRMLRRLLKPQSSAPESLNQLQYVLLLVSQKDSPFSLPLDDTEFKLETLSVVLLNLLVLCIEILLDRVILL